MTKTIYLVIILLLGTQVSAMDSNKTTSPHSGKIVLHLKNVDVGYPTDEQSNSFSIKQADYIPETGKDFFVFPKFAGAGGTDKRYDLNDIKIVATLSFSDKSVIGKSAMLPSVEQHTSIEIPYQNESKLISVGYTLQGKGFYNCRFDSIGKLTSDSNMHCETLGSAWIVPWSSWNYYNGEFYAYVKYPYDNEKEDTFRTFFGTKFQ